MIQENELRIGNWVNDSFAGFAQVSGADLANWEAINCSPIPLSVELLEQCGATKSSIDNPFFSHYDFPLSRDRHISVSNPGTPNEMVMLLEKNHAGVPSVVCLRNFDYDGKTYLHQLQNLYFSLTGEELKINLTQTVK